MRSTFGGTFERPCARATNATESTAMVVAIIRRTEPIELDYARAKDMLSTVNKELSAVSPELIRLPG